LITHKLKEIMAVTDRVSVMRRGAMVATLETKATSPEQLARLMVRMRVLLRVVKSERAPERTVLEVKHLMVKDAAGTVRVDDVLFIVRGGGVVGIAVVAGNGQSELLEAITGIRPWASGEIRL